MNAAMAYSIFAVGAGCFVWMLKYYGSVVDDDDLFHVWSIMSAFTVQDQLVFDLYADCVEYY